MFRLEPVRRLLARLGRSQLGQVTAEYMLLIAVIVAEIVAAYYLLAPALRQAFWDLAKRIITNKP